MPDPPPLIPQDVRDLLARYTTPFPAVPPDDSEAVRLPSQRPNPTQPDVYGNAKAASRLVNLAESRGPSTSKAFAVSFYLVVVYYALEAAILYRQQRDSIAIDEWYGKSDDLINEGYDRALLWFYPLGDDGAGLAPRGTQFLGGGLGCRFRPPSRVRVEAWSRAAMDSQLRRWVAAEVELEKSPGPIIARIRLPYISDLAPKVPGCEDIVWETSEGGLRAMTLQVHRRGWVWYMDVRAVVEARVRTPSSVN